MDAMQSNPFKVNANQNNNDMNDLDDLIKQL